MSAYDIDSPWQHLTFVKAHLGSTLEITMLGCIFTSYDHQVPCLFLMISNLGVDIQFSLWLVHSNCVYLWRMLWFSVSLCGHMRVGAGMSLCALVWWLQKGSSGFLLCHPPSPHFPGTGSVAKLEARLAVSKPQRCSCLCSMTALGFQEHISAPCFSYRP